MMLCRRVLPLILALLVGFSGAPARAESGRDAGPTPPRLSFFDGEVSFWRPGAEDWAPAQVNTALAAGDAVYAGDGANLELQMAARSFVRAGAGTEIGLDSLEPGYTQLRVTGGHAAFDFRRLPSGQRVEVDTPGGAFMIERSGYYRVDVDDNGTAFVARRGGAATVIPAGGEETDVPENRQVVLRGTENVEVAVNAAPDPDEWDRWNDARTAPLAETPRSAQYVPPDVAGVDDLDRSGDWRDEPRYGHVWVPRDVPPDWAPYSTGRWVYDPYYEWTWVDEAPWGWAPYHYGRWVYGDGFWGWAPGPVVVAPVYAPALVAFFGAPGIGVSVGVGLPFVSWCALGFGEPVIPWWGGGGFVGTPFWGGWGGPHIVNNVVVNNTTIVNVRNITKFQNVSVRNAVVGVQRDRFGRGRVEHVRLDPEHVQRLRPVRGNLGVKPVAASLVPKEGRGRRPPENLHARQVVATRRPQDSSGRLRAAGIPVQAPRGPQPRIVTPRRGPGAGQRPGAPGRPAERPPPPGQHLGAGARPEPRRAAPEAPGRAAPSPRPRPGHPGERAPTRPGAEGRATPPPPPASHERAVRPHPPQGRPTPPAGERRAPARPGAEGRATPPPPPPSHERAVRPHPQGRPTPPAGERRAPARPGAEGRTTPSPPPRAHEQPGRQTPPRVERQAPPPSARRPEPPARQTRPAREPRPAAPPAVQRAPRAPREAPHPPAAGERRERSGQESVPPP